MSEVAVRLRIECSQMSGRASLKVNDVVLFLVNGIVLLVVLFVLPLRPPSSSSLVLVLVVLAPAQKPF